MRPTGEFNESQSRHRAGEKVELVGKNDKAKSDQDLPCGLQTFSHLESLSCVI